MDSGEKMSEQEIKKLCSWNTGDCESDPTNPHLKDFFEADVLKVKALLDAKGKTMKELRPVEEVTLELVNKMTYATMSGTLSRWTKEIKEALTIEREARTEAEAKLTTLTSALRMTELAFGEIHSKAKLGSYIDNISREALTKIREVLR